MTMGTLRSYPHLTAKWGADGHSITASWSRDEGSEVPERVTLTLAGDEVDHWAGTGDPYQATIPRSQVDQVEGLFVPLEVAYLYTDEIEVELVSSWYLPRKIDVPPANRPDPFRIPNVVGMTHRILNRQLSVMFSTDSPAEQFTIKYTAELNGTEVDKGQTVIEAGKEWSVTAVSGATYSYEAMAADGVPDLLQRRYEYGPWWKAPLVSIPYPAGEDHYPAIALDVRAPLSLSTPLAATGRADRMDVFAHCGGADGFDGAAHRFWSSVTGYSAWESLRGNACGRMRFADATSWGPGRLDVFAFDEAGCLMHGWYEQEWGHWEHLGLVVDPDKTKIAACSWAHGRLDLFAAGGAGNALLHCWYEAGWHPWKPIPIPSIGSSTPIMATCLGPDAIALLAVDGGRLTIAGYRDGTWSSWKPQSIPAVNQLQSDARVGAAWRYRDLVEKGGDPDVLTVFAGSVDGLIWRLDRKGTEWSARLVSAPPRSGGAWSAIAAVMNLDDTVDERVDLYSLVWPKFELAHHWADDGTNFITEYI